MSPMELLGEFLSVVVNRFSSGGRMEYLDQLVQVVMACMLYLFTCDAYTEMICMMCNCL